MFSADTRGATVQVGAILLFGMIIVSMSFHQSFVVPQENRAVEFEHQTDVENELKRFRNAVLSSALTDTDRSTEVTLGTTYPQRTMFVSPPPASGRLRTTSLGPVVVGGATAAGEAGDYWNGTNHSFVTSDVAYEPSYTELQNSPTTRYEHSVLYDSYGEDNAVAQTGQVLVDGTQVTVVVVNGSYQSTQTKATSVDLDVVSGSTRSVSVTDGGDPVTLTIPTNLPEDDWRALLEDELDLGALAQELDTDFEGGTFGAWTENAAEAGVDGSHDGTTTPGPESGYLDSHGTVTSPTMNTSGSVSMDVSFWWQMDADRPPEAGQNEDLIVEYRDASGSWVEIDRVDSANPSVTPGTEGTRSLTITDPDAMHEGFRFRFRQEGSSSEDRWHFDNVDITSDTGSGDNDAYIAGFSYNATPDPNRLTLTFERNAQYQLRMAKLGVGSDVDTSDAAAHYIVDVRGSETGVGTDGRRKLVAEVRDRYNNPVPGVTVNVTGVSASRLSATTVTTDVDGRAAVTYTAPDATTVETVTMQFDGGAADRQRATFDLYVGGGGGGGGSGGLAWTTAADWDVRSDERGVVHESQTDTDWPGGGAIELGYQSDDESGDSLVSYWPLDEDSGSTATDVAGPHDGTIVGADGGDDGVFGRTAYGFSDANGEYVDLGDVDAGDDTDRLTISAWFYADVFDNSLEPRIVSKAVDNAEDDHIWMLSQDEQGGNDFLRVRLRTGSDTKTHFGPRISTGAWNHGVMTYDGSQVCVYVDAGTPDCFAQSGSIPSSDHPTFIGANPSEGSAERFWDGEIDEVRIYDRALSESEVQNLHDASTSGYLVTDWRNESSAMDVSAMELSSVDASVPSGTSVTVYVQSDTDGDGSVDETSNAITVDGSTGSYTVEGLSTDTDTFRLRVELTSSGPTESPTFSGAELSST